ncbi:hypothetical protein CHELA40_40169 [Chelatococcus asaccharovorans]|nr:hypothetical protein CHELA40_40169 [Chelatococcus asaccharovorans]
MVEGGRAKHLSATDSPAAARAPTADVAQIGRSAGSDLFVGFLFESRAHIPLEPPQAQADEFLVRFEHDQT